MEHRWLTGQVTVVSSKGQQLTGGFRWQDLSHQHRWRCSERLQTIEQRMMCLHQRWRVDIADGKRYEETYWYTVALKAQVCVWGGRALRLSRVLAGSSVLHSFGWILSLPSHERVWFTDLTA